MPQELRKDEGIIIGITEYKESSLLIHILNKNGIYPLILKGAKKLTSKNHSIAKLGGKFSFDTTVTFNVNTVTDAVEEEIYPYLYNDIDKYNCLSDIFEIIFTLRESITNYDILYNFVENLIKLLDVIDRYEELILIFKIKFLYLVGIAPLFKDCILCHNNYNDGIFSLNDGGVVCVNCINKIDTYNNYLLNIELTKVFKDLYFINVLDIDNDILKSIDEYKNELTKFINFYYGQYLDYRNIK